MATTATTKSANRVAVVAHMRPKEGESKTATKERVVAELDLRRKDREGHCRSLRMGSALVRSAALDADIASDKLVAAPRDAALATPAVLLCVAQHCNLPTVGALRRTCSRFNAVLSTPLAASKLLRVHHAGHVEALVAAQVQVDDLWALFRALHTQRILFLAVEVRTTDAAVLARRSIVLPGEKLCVTLPLSLCNEAISVHAQILAVKPEAELSVHWATFLPHSPSVRFGASERYGKADAGLNLWGHTDCVIGFSFPNTACPQLVNYHVGQAVSSVAINYRQSDEGDVTPWLPNMSGGTCFRLTVVDRTVANADLVACYAHPLVVPRHLAESWIAGLSTSFATSLFRAEFTLEFQQTPQ